MNTAENQDHVPDQDHVSDQEKDKGDCKEDTKKDFKKIIFDFSKDLLKTYPELENTLDADIRCILEEKEDDEVISRLYTYCEKVYPERFFDILYQNEEIFEKKDINVAFLPNIDFGPLWKENITDNTRQSIWKYLQLVLFTIVTSLSNEESFGDTATVSYTHLTLPTILLV